MGHGAMKRLEDMLSPETQEVLRRQEFESIQRVAAMLDYEANRAPTPALTATWRRLASNTRREMQAERMRASDC